MFRPLHVISAAFLILVTLCRFCLGADQPFQRFLPLLVDLAGWQGKKPEGMSAQMSDASVTTAARDYERGTAQVHASVVIGQAAEGALRRSRPGSRYRPPKSHYHGKQAGHARPEDLQYEGQDGRAAVALGKDCMFSFALRPHQSEALPLAEKFDWKALQTAAQTK